MKINDSHLQFEDEPELCENGVSLLNGEDEVNRLLQIMIFASGLEYNGS